MTARDETWVGAAGIAALVAFAVAALVLALTGCSSGRMRAPDYVEASPMVTWSDADLSMSGTAEGGPGSGQPWSGAGDADGRGYGLAITLGWRLARPELAVAQRLEALQTAYLARPAPPAPVVEVPAVSVDPALQAALEALAVSVRRLEETVAAGAEDSPPETLSHQTPPDAPGGDSTPWWHQAAGAMAAAVLGALAQLAGLPGKAWRAVKRG